MDVDTAIRTRRTHKAFRPDPVPREILDELFELARWAPNHNLTNPWRFRVVGPRALERLKRAAGPEAAAKLDRAPTLVVCSCVLGGDPVQDEEDLHATACAAYIVLLAAHARGLAGYWRTPEVLRTEAGRAAVGLPEDERFVSLIHLGEPIQEKARARARARRRHRHLPRLARCSRATDALEALGGERFDVVVIGGGITGAGVALDAASRGYSVALVERDDYASGTSSRSSKMVHGGLRYLQNFDLGLVREALLERQLMVQLAPHLVYPTPFLVPTLGEERRNWRIGIGLNMYDVMATTRVGQGRRERQARERASQERASLEQPEDDYWAPDRHRTIPGDEAAELIPALASRDPKEAYLFYDCQTDDVRLVLTVLGEAERFGAVFCNGAEVVELISDGGQGRGRRLRGRRKRRALRGPGRQRGQRDRGLGRPHPPGGDPRRGGGAADRPEPRHPHHGLPRASFRLLQAACIVPAGEERTIFALPWYGRALIGTTDRDYDGRHRARPAVRRGHRVPARGGQLVLRRSSLARPTSPAPTPACGR